MQIKATTTQMLRLVREAAPKVIEANLKISVFNLTMWFQHHEGDSLYFTYIDSIDYLRTYTDLAEQYEGQAWYIVLRAC